MSRLAERSSEGRPALPLAHAVAQHLKDNGFSYSEIARLMNVTSEAARKRCASSERRSLMLFAERSEGVGP